MSNDDHSLKDPKVRAEHYTYRPGRPTYNEILASVSEMVAFVGPYALPDDTFISNDICLSIWSKYAYQHGYIGHHLSALEREGKLPIKRIGTLNRRALYSIAI